MPLPDDTLDVLKIVTHAWHNGAQSLKLDCDTYTLTVWFGMKLPSEGVVEWLEKHGRP